jgi:SAM-dependent methyltransferase
MNSPPDPHRQQFSEVERSVAGFSHTDWQNRYDEGRTGWDRGEASPILRSWLSSGVLKPCRILVPGCGRGHEVIALAEAGFQVTGVDFADAAVKSLSQEIARRKLQAEVVQSDVFRFAPDIPFDAIYEQTCLCAIHPGQWERYADGLRSWLRPDGRLFAVFMQTDKPEGPPFHCSVDEMQKLFALGWEWETSAQRVDHPAGLHELAFVLRRM